MGKVSTIEVSIETLNTLFRLDADEGKLYRRSTGKEAGSVQRVGENIFYNRVGINRKAYYTHRVIFAIAHGYWPDVIDHADGDRLNNKLSNLIAGGTTANMRNRASFKNESQYGRGVAVLRNKLGDITYYVSKVGKVKLGTGIHKLFPANDNHALLSAQIYTLNAYYDLGYSDRHIESLIKTIEANPDYQSWNPKINQIR